MNTKLKENLPSFIEGLELSEEAKVVLGGIFQSYIVGTNDQDEVYKSNEALRKICGIKKQTLLDALDELSYWNFYERTRGSRRTKGCKATASSYRINFEVIAGGKAKKMNALERLLKVRETRMGPANANAECIIQNTENTIQNTENIIQNTEVRSQKSESTIQNTEKENTTSIQQPYHNENVLEEDCDVIEIENIFKVDEIRTEQKLFGGEHSYLNECNTDSSWSSLFKQACG